MTEGIINLQDWRVWLQSAPGRYLLSWEQERIDEAVTDAFGYHALQLGMPMLQALRSNRMPHRWLAHDVDGVGANLVCDFAALPFDAASLDLVVMPHTLELSTDPHATLREVERALVPEGRLVITCFNPSSLWGLAQRRAHVYQRLGFGQLYLPRSGEFLGYRRLRDWLHLLGFEIEAARFGGYRFAVRQERWFDRHAWMERMGSRWWPIFGAMYCVTAVKRVRAMRLIGPAWKTRPVVAGAPVTVAHQTHRLPGESP
jgi:SAM-dependent methyltransferase